MNYLNNINQGVINYITDSKNPLSNFLLGDFYEEIGQTASAAGFYIRAAEFGESKLLSYESLLRVGLCLTKQGSRTFLTKGVYLRAISIIPDRPEAYFLLSRLYEQSKDWSESYSFAVIGERLFKDNTTEFEPLLTNVEYPGVYGFTFERAVSSWWLGLSEESINLFKTLKKEKYLTPEIRESVNLNLKNLWSTWKKPIKYDDTMYNKLRHKFTDSIDIKENYSQAYQDMFVLTMLDGKKNGKFLEIGCGDPFFGNNSYLLENQFGWEGISVDINPSTTEKFSKYRKSKVITGNAVTLDYRSILNESTYDYLQIDCEPSITSLNVLKKIPFDKCKFAVITFEHDFYNGDNEVVRRDARKYLESNGYLLVSKNIAADDYYAFEDWFVHPGLVDKDIIDKMLDLSETTKRADKYMLINTH